MTVEWRPVPGYEGLYEVSSDGQVRRVGKAARAGAGRGGGARIGRIRKLRDVPGGYLGVQLWRDGKSKGFLAHVLVAAAFIGPRPDGREVNHKDGDKLNNSLGNLEYLTRPDNLRHAYRTGLRQPTTAGADARRKPRVIVACACGCGDVFETPDPKGRNRRFVHGHGGRKTAA